MNEDDELLPDDATGEEDEEDVVEYFDDADIDEDFFDEMDYVDEFDELEDEVQSSLEIVDANLDKFLSVSSVQAVYGEPIEHGDTVIIPAAEVLSGMGFGVGVGSSSSNEEEEDEEEFESNRGGGGGGGGYAFSRPVAVIIASPEGVRVEPVVDVTKLALAGLTAAGMVFGTLYRMMRGR